MKRRIIVVMVLALLLSGCWVQTLADPANPELDSLEIAHAYAVQSDLMLVIISLFFVVLSGIAGMIVFGWRRRR